ncbi:hypothetical protein [Serratia sp. 14-2641]|uniref:hypothetical protein n=1 Tax=Serratia sp. 14-2641 TaxID=1841657 RepID=UPI001301709C|nr:hypothetical protein [Serratia sp. 14-2641]
MRIRISKDRWLCCNTLPRELWYFGYVEDWYDGPIPCFGFGFFHFYLWYDYMF